MMIVISNVSNIDTFFTIENRERGLIISTPNIQSMFDSWPTSRTVFLPPPPPRPLPLGGDAVQPPTIAAGTVK